MPAFRSPFTAAAFSLFLFLHLTTSVAVAQSALELAPTATSGESPPSAVDKISAETSSISDAEISERLRRIYSELDQYKDITVLVSNSVVSLQGELLSAVAIEEAETLARKVSGVADVDNQLQLETNVTERLNSSIGELATESKTVISSLPLYALALAIMVGSWFLGRYLSSKRSLLLQLAPNTFIAELLGNIVRLVILVAGLFLALRLLDATHVISTVLSAAGIVGLAVGFAVRDTVENYIASILLSLRNPFKIRDYIVVDGFEGSVARLTSRATILVSAEGNYIRIPNAIVYKSVIVNYSRNPLRQFDFSVGIDSGDSILRAQQLAQATLQQVEGVLKDPPSSIVVSELGESNTTLTIRAWIDQQHYDLLKVRSESIRQVKEAFDSDGIVMPEPIYRLVINNAGENSSASDKTTQRQPDDSIDTPVQDLNAERVVDSAITAELEQADEENLLSESSAHE